MATLKEESQVYKPKTTLNIADLDRVDLSFPVEDRKKTNSDGEEYDIKVMVVNGMEYRVPLTVLEEIQKMLRLKPDLTHVSVTKKGDGLNTRYEVNVA